MRGAKCPRCGSGGLVAGPVSVCCQVCGGREFRKGGSPDEMWAEHRLGLLYGPGGWRWLEVIGAPGWFIENVI